MVTGSDVARGAAADTQDDWLDELSQGESEEVRSTPLSRLAGSLEGPWLGIKRLLSFVTTTPGTMLSITLVLALALFAAGFSMSQSSVQRQNALDDLLTSTEPLSSATHNLYTNLSLADTVITASFVEAGVPTDEDNDRYHQAISQASIAASQTARGLPDGNQRLADLITIVQTELPVYAGLVEYARANYRTGNPVGVTYMANASNLMRTEILPAASELFSRTSNQVSQEQQQLSSPQWVPLSGLVAAVIFLSLAQWWLWRKTRRRINRGFAVATVLMVLAVGWVSMSNFATWQAGSRGFEQASEPWDQLTTARIQAQQARTTETLSLVRRESVEATTVSFDRMTDTVANALAAYAEVPGSDEATIATAQAALDDWRNAHADLADAMSKGNYDEAMYLISETEPYPDGSPTSAGSYDTLDTALRELIDDARTAMRSFIGVGLAATQLVATAVLLLSLAAVVAVGLGIRPRLLEYL